ncbi:efflux RND transporter periplasmic adaptor subunit [candidate division KSB1 bacterium]|nr:MAG: efflux RND transporter periplasmic adaptor subunit [candidate division KSB1 bacterium]MBC6950292.1 efflux RND transporter periplasmic adaptor subunit [candidate division KSB1 bacterium]MCE7943794.1 efflux RND transporter periplasmic adaptor subunit [Chlorobi bacterium CHB1]MDL1874940.1 efflux RND transporter periplasmic adaptor subunit [Cytophagia bacterium CHB2]
MSKKKKLLIGSGLVVAVAALVGTAVMKKNGKQEIEVQTAPVKRQRVVETVTATGKVQPHIQVKISADVSAKITKLAVSEGAWVEKGDFLLELDRERYIAAVERAEASLRSAESDAKLARESMLKAEKDYQRTKELHEKQLESSAAYDAAAATYQVEKARFESASSSVEQSRALLKQANDDLSKTRIYAPMAGTISQLNKEVGEIALGSQFQEDVILVVSDLVGMEALVEVDENDVVAISLGDTANIEVDALPNTIFRGYVSEIANTAKVTGSGTADQQTEFEVKVAITGTTLGQAANGVAQNLEITQQRSTADLRPGMTASSDIVTETRDSTLAVPIQCVTVRTMDQLQKKPAEGKSGEAIANESSEPQFTPDKDGFVEIVFVVKEGAVEARQVKTGIQSNTHIEILTGLAEGDEIVTGSYRAISKDLQHGAKVMVKNAEKKNQT